MRLALTLLAAILLAGCSAQPAGNESGAAMTTTPPYVSQPAQQAPTVRRVTAYTSPAAVPSPPLTPEVLAGGTTQNRVVTGGWASWYPARGDVASVPWWRYGMEPRWAAISRFADGRTYAVTVLIVGFCQCHVGKPDERVIDLSLSAFRQLHRPDIPDPGLLKVTVELTDAGPGLPATSTKEGP